MAATGQAGTLCPADPRRSTARPDQLRRSARTWRQRQHARPRPGHEHLRPTPVAWHESTPCAGKVVWPESRSSGTLAPTLAVQGPAHPHPLSPLTRAPSWRHASSATDRAVSLAPGPPSSPRPRPPAPVPSTCEHRAHHRARTRVATALDASAPGVRSGGCPASPPHCLTPPHPQSLLGNVPGEQMRRPGLPALRTHRLTASTPLTCSRVLTTSMGCVSSEARLAEAAEQPPSTHGGSASPCTHSPPRRAKNTVLAPFHCLCKAQTWSHRPGRAAGTASHLRRWRRLARRPALHPTRLLRGRARSSRRLVVGWCCRWFGAGLRVGALPARGGGALEALVRGNVQHAPGDPHAVGRLRWAPSRRGARQRTLLAIPLEALLAP